MKLTFDNYVGLHCHLYLVDGSVIYGQVLDHRSGFILVDNGMFTELVADSHVARVAMNRTAEDFPTFMDRLGEPS